MIYFDNAASGFYKPSSVYAAVENAVKNLSVNAGRSSHALAVKAQELVYNTRKILSKTFNNGAIDRVVFTLNCSEALNLAIFGSRLRYGEIVTTVTEHNSVLRPLSHLEESGVTVRYAAFSSAPKITAKDVLPLVGKKTDLVIMNAVSNVTGEKNDYEEIAEELNRSGIPLILDGAQACGHIPIDMSRGISCLCLAGHKGMFATQGVGALIFNENFDISPTFFGGSGTESFQPKPSYYPELLEVGTQNLPAIASLFEGAKYVSERGAVIAQTLTELTALTVEKLGANKDIKLYSSPNRFGIISFSHARYDSMTLAGLLSERFGFATRGGFHCAPRIHQALGTDIEGLLRVSFSPFNNTGEVEKFCAALSKL